MVESRRYRRDHHELPATLRRSGQEAQDTKAHDRAVQAYGEGDQADRAAYTALKEKYKRRGDHWIAKRDPAD
jgi:ChaB